MATCEYCGKEFQPKDKRSNKACSHSCAAKLKYKTESKESVFAKKFNEKYKGRFEYAGKYSGSEEAFNRRCLVCGDVTEATAQCIRQNHSADVCLNCARNKRDVDAANKQRKLDEKRAKRKALKQLKETERLRERMQKLIFVCCECGDTFMGNRAGAKYCSDECKRKYGNRRRETNRREKLKKNGKVDYSISLQRLVQRDECVCHICGKRVNMNVGTNATEYGSIDHVIPVSKGGTHTWDNVKLAHRGCNSAKRDKTIYEKHGGQMVMCV